VFEGAGIATFARSMKNLIAALLLFPTFLLFSQTTSINGKLFGNGESLPGAIVKVQGTNLGSVTELDGTFSIINVSPGKHTIVFTYLGYETLRKEITVLDKQRNDLGKIELKENEKSLNEVEITAKLKQASESKAINMMHTSARTITVISSETIKKLPDKNAAETVKRVAGVGVQNNKGEGSFVSLRGTPADWTATLVNGHRLPVADEENATRSFEFEVLPSELVDYVIVTRTVTPDIEGDNIGGAINFITRQAVEKRTFQMNASGGVNALARKPTWNLNFLYGDRTKDGKFSFVINGSYYGRYYGAQGFRTYFDPFFNQSINQYHLKDYHGLRQTIGGSAAFEYKHKTIKIGGNFLFGYMIDDKYQKRTLFNYDDGSGSRVRLQNVHGVLLRQLFGGEINFEHIVNEKLKWTAKVATFHNRFEYGNSPYKNKDKRNGYFAVDFISPLLDYADRDSITLYGDKFLPTDSGLNLGKLLDIDNPYGRGDNWKNIQPKPVDQFSGEAFTNANADQFRLYEAFSETNTTWERDPIVAQTDFFYSINNNIKLQFGAKFRMKEGYRSLSFHEWKLRIQPPQYPSTPRYLTSYFQTENFNESIGFLPELGSPYKGKMYPFLTDAAINNFIYQLADTLYDYPMQPGNDNWRLWIGSTYQYREFQSAGYAMADVKIGDKISLVGGLRVEHTWLNQFSDTSALEPVDTVVEFNGQVSPIKYYPSIRQTIQRGYIAFLPSLNMVYAISSKMNLRAAVSRTFHRPNFEESKPGGPLYKYIEQEFVFGNKNIKPAYSVNFDLTYEYYWGNKGMFSIGGYYKYVTDHILQVSAGVTIESQNRFASSYINTPVSHVVGVEANFTRQFDFLPKFLSGFGLSANITYSYSRMKLPGRNFYQAMSEQSPLLYNVALFYEKYGLSARLALNYNAPFLHAANLVVEQRQDGTVGLLHDNNTDFDLFHGQQYALDAQIGYTFKKRFTIYAEANNLLDWPELIYRGRPERPFKIEYYRQRGQIGFKFEL
jgi:TonB-dependent receptor